MFSIWTVIQRPTWEDEPWVADLWVRTNAGSEFIYETVVDPDYQMFQHWLSYHISKGTEAYALTMGSRQDFVYIYQSACDDYLVA